MLSRFFQLSEHKTSVSREVQAGLTTFAAMAYVLAVNPSILAVAGMPKDTLVTVTAISAAFGTLLMALMTNYPLALAPGMGINAYFAFTVCGALGVPWQSALGLVFVNGIVFLLLSVSGIREKIVNSIPYSLKMATTCGIGFFIAFIGLKNGGIIVANPATFVSQGNLGSPSVALCFFGIILTAVLVVRRVPGAIILSILALTLIGLFMPDGKGGHLAALPSSFFSAPASIAPTFHQLRFDFLIHDFAKAFPIILTLLLVDMFDNIGTLIGVTQRAGLLGSDGKLPRIGRALMADSIAAIVSSILGTSTVVSYIESASGVEAGGRTGLTAVVTAFCFLLALFLTPVILTIPAVATAPALIIVGIFMFQSAANIKLEDLHEVIPAVITIIAIPLTFSIAEGIGFGLISCALLSIATGRGKTLSAATYILAAVFFFHLFKGLFTSSPA